MDQPPLPPPPQPPARAGGNVGSNRTRTRRRGSLSSSSTAAPNNAATMNKPLSVVAEPFFPSPALQQRVKTDPYLKLPPLAQAAATKTEEGGGKPPSRSRRQRKPTTPPTTAESTTATTKSKKSSTAPAAPKPAAESTASSFTSKKPALAAVKRWWHSLKDVDPITLFPLRNLKIEPFELSVSDSKVKHFFDCESLASYLLQTGKFLDPINRQPISRDECLRLDAHLRRYGLKQYAKCVEMMDLQNSAAITSSSNNAQGVVDDRRRQQVVLTTSLFQYPSLLDASSNRRQGGGGVRVMDDDEAFEYMPSAPPDHQIVEDDFPEMPLVRRRATADDFPVMASRNANNTWVCPQCTLENADSRSCTACGQANPAPPSVAARVPQLWQAAASSSENSAIRRAPPPSVAASSSLESWRRQRAAAEEDDSARPRLILAAPSTNRLAEPTTRSESLFGKAKPVDFALHQDNDDNESLLDSSTELCPYSPWLVHAASSYGLTWLLSIERMLRELIDLGSTRRTVSLEPMPETKRNLIKELAWRYYGLQCQECDPEPKRFIQLSNTPISCVPELTLSKAMITFPSSRFRLEATSSPSGILLVGVQISPQQLSQHVLVRGLNLRESEFDLFWLENLVCEDNKVCFVNIASAERARKTCKRLMQGSERTYFKRVMFWPCGIDWARAQIRALNMNARLAKQPDEPSAAAVKAEIPERETVAAFAKETLLFAEGKRMSAADLGQRIYDKFGLAYQDMQLEERTLTHFLLNETQCDVVRVGQEFVLKTEQEEEEEQVSSDEDSD